MNTSQFLYKGNAIPSLNEPPHDKTNKLSVRPGKTQISLGICPVWSESSLCTQWVAKDPSFLYVDNKDSDQTGRMPRLIWVFTGCICHFVGFVMRRLILSVANWPLKATHLCGWPVGVLGSWIYVVLNWNTVENDIKQSAHQCIQEQAIFHTYSHSECTKTS